MSRCICNRYDLYEEGLRLGWCGHCGWSASCECGYEYADNIEYEYDDSYQEGYE